MKISTPVVLLSILFLGVLLLPATEVRISSSGDGNRTHIAHVTHLETTPTPSRGVAAPSEPPQRTVIDTDVVQQPAPRTTTSPTIPPTDEPKSSSTNSSALSTPTPTSQQQGEALLTIPTIKQLSSLSSTADGTAPLWVRCVRDLGSYATSWPINVTTLYGGVYVKPKENPSPLHAFGWKPNNPCGFHTIDLKRRDPELPPEMKMHFVGDSLAMHAFSTAVLEANPRLNGKLPKKVWPTPHLEFELTRSPKKQVAEFTRILTMSVAPLLLPEVFAKLTNGHNDVLVLIMGVWDLNWILFKKKDNEHHIPGWRGGPNMTKLVPPFQSTWSDAQQNWLNFIDDFAKVLQAELLKRKPEDRPKVVFREQLLPNCRSPRFDAPKRKYRRCNTLIRPEVVPFYRMTLEPLLHAMNIPIVSIGHLFRDSADACQLSDGLHLDMQCRSAEVDHLLNVFLLLRREHVTQGGAAPLPPSRAFSKYWSERSYNYTTRLYDCAGVSKATRDSLLAKGETGHGLCSDAPLNASHPGWPLAANSTLVFRQQPVI